MSCKKTIRRPSPSVLADQVHARTSTQHHLQCMYSSPHTNTPQGSSEEEESDEEANAAAEEERQTIQDATETNLVNLRRTIYLTIMSSLDFEEAGHKLLKIQMAPGQEAEIPIMIIECASQERTYIRYYGLLGARFCMLRKEYQVGRWDSHMVAQQSPCL